MGAILRHMSLSIYKWYNNNSDIFTDELCIQLEDMMISALGDDPHPEAFVIQQVGLTMQILMNPLLQTRKRGWNDRPSGTN